jgi:hypothetical protein
MAAESKGLAVFSMALVVRWINEMGSGER